MEGLPKSATKQITVFAKKPPLRPTAKLISDNIVGDEGGNYTIHRGFLIAQVFDGKCIYISINDFVRGDIPLKAVTVGDHTIYIVDKDVNDENKLNLAARQTLDDILNDISNSETPSSASNLMEISHAEPVCNQYDQVPLGEIPLPTGIYPGNPAPPPTPTVEIQAPYWPTQSETQAQKKTKRAAKDLPIKNRPKKLKIVSSSG